MSVNNDSIFNIDWLSNNFKCFTSENVKKAEFDDLGLMYEIYFKDATQAQKFVDTLERRGCNPQYFKFNQSVCLNKYQAEKIKQAAMHAENIEESVSTPKEHLLVPEIIRDSALEAQVPQPLAKQPNSEQSPFDVTWLSHNFGCFKPEDIKKAEFDNLGLMYEIYFKDATQAQKFVDTLEKRGCNPRYSNFDQSVCLNKYQAEKIKDAIALGKIPFNEEWLRENYNLDLNQVEKIEHSSSGIKISFKLKLESMIAFSKFLGTLKHAGCEPSVWRSVIDHVQIVSLLNNQKK